MQLWLLEVQNKCVVGRGEFNQMLKNLDVWMNAGGYSTAMEGYPNTVEVFNVHKFAYFKWSGICKHPHLCNSVFPIRNVCSVVLPSTAWCTVPNFGIGQGITVEWSSECCYRTVWWVTFLFLLVSNKWMWNAHPVFKILITL